MRTILFIISFFCTISISAQNYFQQEVNYTINVSLNDVEHSISGFETIEYINNSPDELTFIWFHLWPNAYKNTETALGKQMEKIHNKAMIKAVNGTYGYNTGYIDSLNFMVNNQAVKIENHPQHIDICKLILNQPLKSGERITITTPFKVMIPSGNISRLGHIGRTYQITQWYPKPAVYDALGWHEMPYLNQGEFYSEFGSFDVSITLNESYVVGASGNLQTQSEVEWLTKKAQETASLDSFSRQFFSLESPTQNTKTIRYTLQNAHDFAWFADRDFYVLKSEVELPYNKKKVTTWAMFSNHNAELWKKAPEYINDAIYYYSKWNGDYAYDNCTALQSALSAGGGMEYPTITVIGGMGTALSLEEVIMHEVGHNWFYGILGFNERRYPFLDEGINTSNELRYMATKYPELTFDKFVGISDKLKKMTGLGDYPMRFYYDMLHSVSAGMNWDQVANLPSEQFSDINYGTIVYMKVGGIFNTLRNYLGDELYDKTMQTFYNEWKFKHPYPEDVRKAFEQATGKNLSWFFDDLIGTTKKADYALCMQKNNKLLVRNKGDITTPFSINFDSETPLVKWYDGFEGKQWIEIPADMKTNGIFTIDKNYWLYEKNRQNNTLNTQRLFKKIEPLKLKFAGGWDNPQRTEIYYLPIVGFNTADKLMVGALIHNSLIPKKKLEYAFMPLFSTGTKSLAGTARMEYHLLPYSKIIEDVTFRLSAKRYGYDIELGTSKIDGSYLQLRADMEIMFRKADYSTQKYNMLNLSAIQADEPWSAFDAEKLTYTRYFLAQYKFVNNRMIHPFDYQLNMEASDDGMLKLYTELNFTHAYKNKRKSFDARLFFGKIINTGDYSAASFMSLDGRNGTNDYLFDYTFMNRFDGFANYSNSVLSHQFVKSEGGFTTYAPTYASDNWLFAINLSTTIPKVPMAIYANVAMQPESEFFAEAGVEIRLLKDIASVYLPLLVTSNLQSQMDMLTDNYLQNIRFTFNLHKLNVFNILNQPTVFFKH